MEKKSKSTKKKVKLLHYNVIIDKQPIKIVVWGKNGSALTLAKPTKANKAAHETDKWRAKCSHCQSTYIMQRRKNKHTHNKSVHTETHSSHITIAWQLPSIGGQYQGSYMLMHRTSHNSIVRIYTLKSRQKKNHVNRMLNVYSINSLFPSKLLHRCGMTWYEFYFRHWTLPKMHIFIDLLHS